MKKKKKKFQISNIRRYIDVIKANDNRRANRTLFLIRPTITPHLSGIKHGIRVISVSRSIIHAHRGSPVKAKMLVTFGR